MVDKAFAFLASKLNKLAGGKKDTNAHIIACQPLGRDFQKIFEGWLTKKGDLNSDWKKRYFILCKPGYLFYFEDSTKGASFLKINTFNTEESGRLCKGSINLIAKDSVVEKSGTVDGNANCLTIRENPAAERTFLLSAPSTDEQDKWAKACKELGDYGKTEEEKNKPVFVAVAVVASSAAARDEPMKPAFALPDRLDERLLPISTIYQLIQLFEQIQNANWAYQKQLKDRIKALGG